MSTAAKSRLNPADVIERGKKVLDLEARSVSALAARLDQRFVRAVELMLGCTGKIVVTGMGKSGHVCRKIAATLASTGSPALFLHPGEGAHGDLGVIASGDIVIAISQSGETEEVVRILPSLKRLGVPVIAVTGKPGSTLGTSGEVCLDVSVEEEACPLGLAPTSSTTATLAMGDALAVAVLDARGFRAEDFAANHPGGSLGRKLLLRVEDVMHTGNAVPLVPETMPVADAIYEISSKKLGVTGVLDEAGNLSGVFTDGDLRRTIQNTARPSPKGEGGGPGAKPLETTSNTEPAKAGAALFSAVASVMTRNPKRITRSRLAVDALNLMQQYKITSLFVFEDDAAKKPAGIVHLHDLLKAGLS